MSTVSHVTSENFERDVLGSATPVLVDFYATWCMPCRMLSPVVDRIAAEYAGRLKVLKVDVDSEPELADRYGITGVPTLLFFSGGALRDSLVGLPSPQLLSRAIEKVLAPAAPAAQAGAGNK